MQAIAIFLLGMSALLNTYSTQPVLGNIAVWAGIPATSAAWTISASTFGVALAAPIAGRISDRYGRKRIFIPAVWAMAGTAILCAVAPSFPLLLIIRVVQGVCCPFVFAVVVAYVDEERAQRATSLNALYVAGTAFGGFVGRFLAGIIVDLTGSWRWSFLGNALVFIGIALSAQIILPRESHFSVSVDHGNGLRSALHLLSDWRIGFTMVVGFSLLFQQVATLTYGSLTLGAPPFSLSQSVIGFVFVVMLVPTLITPFVGLAIQRHGLLPVMLIFQI